MLQVKQAKPDTQFYRIHIPVGALYFIAPEYVRKGKIIPRAYVWITRAPRRGGGMSASVFTREDGRVKSVYYMSLHPFTKAFYVYCVEHGIDNLVTKPQITHAQANHNAPRDRENGAYIQRARIGYEYMSRHNVTDVSVTSGARVGKTFHTEDSYIHLVMGVPMD